MSKFCENCGTKYEEGTKFCSGCGKQLEGKNEIHSEPELLTSQKNEQIATQNSPTAEPQYTSSAPPDAIVLKSSAPIPSNISWTKWGYIAGLLLLVFGVGAIICLVVFIISNFQMTAHKDKMRRMKFKSVDNITNDDIYNKLQPILSQKYGDKIEIDQEGDTLTINYNSIYYDINLQEDCTFNVWWRKSLASAFFSFNEWKEYKKIRTGTAIVAYEFQKAFGIR